MRQKLRNLSRKFPDEAAKALYEETEIEATEAKRRTPVDKGHLRASIHVDGPKWEGKSVYASIVAGGASAPYAIYVHENLEAFHPVGQAKFIESVILESAPYFAGRVAKRIQLSGMAV